MLLQCSAHELCFSETNLMRFETEQCAECRRYERCRWAVVLIDAIWEGQMVTQQFLDATGYYDRRGHHVHGWRWTCRLSRPRAHAKNK